MNKLSPLFRPAVPVCGFALTIAGALAVAEISLAQQGPRQPGFGQQQQPGFGQQQQPGFAQQGPLQPGEAYVTRFSGTTPGAAGTTIDINGTVGGIIDVRSPRRPPLGQHWIDEPQRAPVTAGEVGQVFGVVLDDATPPNVYLSATSAFGLHRGADNSFWMPGMWGQNGGPGTVYRLDAATGYQPRPFADITLNGRPNSGPALGNIAYDRFNKQLFVSDLETGMIHRVRGADGADLGSYDHGSQGRSAFLDAERGQQGSLPPISFDPNSSARINDCQGRFDQAPECWNFAPSGRRVWGLGVHRNPNRNEVRLYYSVWSGPAFGDPGWQSAQDDDKRNSVWSVQLGPDGSFAGNIRREFIVPDFFVRPEDIARAGYSQPVSDISFATCGPRPVMLLAERGGIRNLGLETDEPFATPHEARALRYELDQNGTWRAVGRYDVGFYDRQKDGQPYIHANCSGGIAFGPGYDPNTLVADPSKNNQYVWITGDFLCSPDGPCNLPGGQPQQAGTNPQQVAAGNSPLDDSQVHGVQGMAENLFEEVSPNFANTAPTLQNPAGSNGLNQSYLIDIDVNVDFQGRVVEQTLTRNDATKICDIAVYEMCEAPASYAGYFLTPSVTPTAGSPPVGFHFQYGSHSTYWSHGRFGSHNQFWSHNRFESHNQRISHWRYASHDRRLSHQRQGSHQLYWSHWRVASHNIRESHNRVGSHDPLRSHTVTGSHDKIRSHYREGSHDRERSHRREGSHDLQRSHSVLGSGEHTTARSHALRGSGIHTSSLSHSIQGSQTHSTERSHALQGSQTHTRERSHAVQGSQGHTTERSHALQGSQTHTTQRSHALLGSQTHTTLRSHAVQGSQGHTTERSHAVQVSQTHTTQRSHALYNSQVHTTQRSHAVQGSQGHTTERSHALQRSQNHGITTSHTPIGSHSTAASRATHTPPGSHSTAASRGTHTPPASHSIPASRGTHTPTGSHSAAASAATYPPKQVHTNQASHARSGSHSRAASVSKNTGAPAITR